MSTKADSYTWECFIAHAGTDKTSAETLFDFLKPHARVFLDSRCLLLGDDWDRKTSRGAKICTSHRCPHLIEYGQGVLPKKRNSCCHCTRTANEELHRVVPVYLDDEIAGSSSVPYGLRLKHGITTSDEPGLDGVADRLLELLEQLRADARVPQLVPSSDLAQSKKKKPEDDLESNQTALSEDLRSSFERWESLLEKARRRKFIFLLVGRTGVGKSSTVNTLIKEPLAPVGAFDPTTMEVKTYKSNIHGLVVVDTPGLCDDLPTKGKDKLYLEKIQSQVPRFHCLWFVVRLDETRLGNDERRAISLITKAFGKEVWERAIIVFTFADKLETSNYMEFLVQRTRIMREAIGERAGNNIASTIPSVAVSNVSDKTPDNKPWLSELVTQIVERISEQGALPFLVTIASRGGISLDDRQRERVQERTQEVEKKLKGMSLSFITGAGVGATVAGIPGAIVGGLFGGLVGGLARLLFTKN